MRLPAWVTLTAWVLLLTAVYLPIAQLGLDAAWSDGRLDLSPFRALLFTESQWRLLKDSLLLAAGATGVALVLGLPFAIFCQRTDLWGRSFFGLAYLVPLLIPPYMQAIVWGRLLAKNGPINDFLMSAWGLAEAPLNVHSLPGAMFVLGLAYFPLRALYSSLQQLEPQLEEMGWILGQSRFRVVVGITLPLVRNGLITGFFIGFVLALGELGVTLLVIPPGMATIPIKVYNFMHYGAEDTVAALCLILVALQLLVSIGLLGLASPSRDGVE